MGSYLRKNWKKSALVCLLQIVEWGFQAGVQLLLMQVFDKALSLDLKAFLFWSAVDMAAWGGYFLVCYLREPRQGWCARSTTICGTTCAVSCCKRATRTTTSRTAASTFPG